MKGIVIGSMDTSSVERALRRLGEVLIYRRDIEILLVGGAAGMLTGLLAPGRVTTDCDVMVSVPAEAMSSVERAAGEIADELGLPERWLNSDVQIRLDALPDGWEQRRGFVAAYGRLRVFAASRPDLIAMKVLAGRDQDIEDLQEMRVRADEVRFVRAYLDSLGSKGTRADQIDEARELLDALGADEHA